MGYILAAASRFSLYAIASSTAVALMLLGASAPGKIKTGVSVTLIEIILIDRKDTPSTGAGEAGIVGIAPAIRNAIVDATGIGLTTLPMLPNGVL